MSVQMRTMLEVADNSGARKLQVILPLCRSGAAVPIDLDEKEPIGCPAFNLASETSLSSSRGFHNAMNIMEVNIFRREKSRSGAL